MLTRLLSGRDEELQHKLPGRLRRMGWCPPQAIRAITTEDSSRSRNTGFPGPRLRRKLWTRDHTTSIPGLPVPGRCASQT